MRSFVADLDERGRYPYLPADIVHGFFVHAILLGVGHPRDKARYGA